MVTVTGAQRLQVKGDTGATGAKGETGDKGEDGSALQVKL